eukprot:6070381-Pleurochrysis_carterae.AAC.1
MSNMAWPCDIPASNEGTSSGKVFLCTGSQYDMRLSPWRQMRMPVVMVKGLSLGVVLKWNLSPSIKVM